MWLNHPKPNSTFPSHVPLVLANPPRTRGTNAGRRRREPTPPLFHPKAFQKPMCSRSGRSSGRLPPLKCDKPTAIPLASFPTHGHATSTSLPNTIFTSGAAAVAVSFPANANVQPTPHFKKSIQRERDGPAPDVTSWSAASDGVEGGIHSDLPPRTPAPIPARQNNNERQVRYCAVSDLLLTLGFHM